MLPSPQQMRVLRTSAAHAETDWRRAIASIDLSAAALLKHAADTTVVRAELALGEPQRCILKTQRMGGLWNKLRCRLGATRLDRQWKGARLLERAGAMPTAECMALLGWKAGDGRGFLTLVMQDLPGRTLLEHMASSMEASQRRALARAVGAHTRSMLEAHVFNRDHKPSNLIVTSLEPPALALIDTVGIAETGARAMEPVRPLTSLMLEPMGCGVAPRLTDRMRALTAFEPDRKARRRLWRRVEAAIKAHGDPTPKDNPLGASQPR